MLFWEDIIALLLCLKYYYFYVNMNFCLESFESEYEHITSKKNYIEIMPTSIPHQKLSFYHLPTRGRAGMLGDAWYVSNVSIIFYCSMLYYLLFWALLGFIIHFYIIFGTNLLTGGPAQICCFMPISVFRRKGISDGVEMERNQPEKLFLEGNTPDGLGPHVRRYGSCPRGWGARPPP